TNTQPGGIVNFGNLAVKQGQNLSLLGGTVLSTGQVSAPGGNITVAAIPGQSLVRISQAGNLLNLEIQPITDASSPIANSQLSVLSIPQLLTGKAGSHATGVTVNNDGTVQLTGTGAIVPTEAGTTIIAGNINVSGEKGGTVNVLGSRVGLINANINASGMNGGGNVRVGGDYKGQGTVPNALRTFVSNDSTINADAIINGDGGRVIVWADWLTGFYGNISARGGSNFGNGGFVEVSGKENLIFRGAVDTSALNGTFGTLLLDPTTLTIVDSIAGSGSLDSLSLFLSSKILAGDGNIGANTVSWELINVLGPNANIILEATGSITISNITGVVSGKADLVALPLTSGSLRISSTGGGITFVDTNDTIQTQGGSITFQALGGNITAGNLSTTASSVALISALGGNVTLEATGDISTNSILANSKPVSITSGGNVNISGMVFTQSSGTIGGNIAINATGNITTADLLSNGGSSFTGIDGSAGNITIASQNGIINTGLIRANGYGGNAGDIRFQAAGNMRIGGIEAMSNSGNASGGNGGNITLVSQTGSIDTGGTSLVSDGINNAGNITLTAAKDIIINSSFVATDVNSNINTSGKIQFTTNTGTIDTRGSEIRSTNTKGGNSGNIIFSSAQNILTGDVITRVDNGNGVAGDIIFTAPNGTIDTTAGGLNSVAFVNGNGSAGNIRFEAGKDILAGNVIVVSKTITPLHGDITILSRTGNILTSSGALQASNLSGSGGNLTLNAPAGNITTGLVTTESIGNGGNINFICSGAIDSTAKQVLSKSQNGNGGTITFQAGGNISTNSVNAQGSLNGANISLQSGGSVNTTAGIINSLGGNSGGSITIKAASNIITSDIALLVSGVNANSGSINITSSSGNIDTSKGALAAPSANGTGGNITLSSPVGNIAISVVNAIATGSGNGGALTFNAKNNISINKGNIATKNNDINFNGAISLTGDTLVSVKGTGDITFKSTVDGPYNLTVKPEAGIVRFFAPVGSVTPLNSVNIQDDIPATPVALSVRATNNITAQNITSPAGITLTSDKGAIQTGNLNSSSSTNGGNVTLNAGGNITVNQIDSQSLGNGTGGNIYVWTEKFFRALNSFTDRNTVAASISSAGGAGDKGGTILLRHGGNGLTPFIVGNSTTN
ncbi:beta strand repeat-containing protein, partial [Microcoleus sp. herbarium14]|uniref:beta strand repeat-containing protein n=1 Tax=Microcoleus sp. herbarium14 TaxID=3055439 RepID=UPI0034DED4ED